MIKAYFETQQIAYETDEQIETRSILFPLVAEIADVDTDTLKEALSANKDTIMPNIVPEKKCL